jgi:hypothetical protein
MSHDDEYMFQTSYDERERTHSPPMFAYSAYPPPDDMLMPGYGAAQSYRPMTTEPYTDYLSASTTVPVTLPSLTHFSDAIKREAFPAGDDSFSPYMNYVGGYVPGTLDMGAPSPYDPNSNPHVSSLRHHQNPPHPASAVPRPPVTTAAPQQRAVGAISAASSGRAGFSHHHHQS